MKRTEPESIGNVLRMAIEQCDMGRKLAECRAVDSWTAVVGSHIASVSSRPTVRNGVMTVRISSPAIRQELTMCRSRLIAELNKASGEQAIHQLRFIS